MPGFANWEQLFAMEYLQLYEEGYPVGETIEPDYSAAYLPDSIRDASDKSALTEADWGTSLSRYLGNSRQGYPSGIPV